MRMSSIILFVCCLLAWSNCSYSEGETTPETIRGIYQLADFGPVDSVAKATATMRKAVKMITAKGGGMLFVTEKTDSSFTSESIVQKQLSETSVVIVDIRQGKLRFQLPSLGFRIPDNPVGYASVFFDREIKQDAININGDNTIVRIDNRVVGGTSSYFQPVDKVVELPNGDRRIYVQTIAGLYKGQRLFAMIGKGGVGDSGEFESSYKITIEVKKLGWDKDSKTFFIEAENLDPALKWGPIASLMNKSTASGMVINDSIHSDLEAPGTLRITKKLYSQGDCFGIGMDLKYMGNIMSTRGDEGGNGYSLDIWQMLDSFKGKVESWNPETHTLVYTEDSIRANTLGTSRLMINLNPKKWLTKGKIAIEANYIENGGVDPKGYVRGIDTNWNDSIVGRAFAVDEKNEYAGSGAGSFWVHGLRGRTVRRWWLITKYEKTKSGEDRLWVERIKHYVYKRATPTLIDERSYRTAMKYIIAPCAMVNDVTKGILKEKKMFIKGASIMPGPEDKRTIILSPSPDTGKAFDFAVGDPIEEAVGADPHHPNGYRVRHRETMPSSIPCASFMSLNNGAYPIAAGLRLFGPHDKMQIKGDSKYQQGVDIDATCDYGIRIRRRTTKAAIMLEAKVTDTPQKIVWKSKSGKEAVLYANPANGRLSVGGNGLHLSNGSLTGVKGISNGKEEARNLRGISVEVNKGGKEIDVLFSTPEKDSKYAVMVQASWLTIHAVTKKTAKGFHIVFGKTAPVGATLDWLIVR